MGLFDAFMGGGAAKPNGAPAFNSSALISLLPKLGEIVKSAFDHYHTVVRAGGTIDADTLAVFVTLQIAEWDPKVAGRSLLDIDTKQAAARFLAGVAFNLAKEG